MPDEIEQNPMSPGTAGEQGHHLADPETAVDKPNEPQPTEAPAVGSSEFQALDPRVINLWRLQQSISSFILLGIAFVVGAVFALANPGARLWILSGWLAFAFLRLFLLIWYPSRSFRARGYRIDDKVLETRRGIWFRVITLLPLSRLQHVDLNRGPLERMFGLASLVLYTAGTQHAMVVIPGLDETEAGRLRDHLVAVGGDDAV